MLLFLLPGAHAQEPLGQWFERESDAASVEHAQATLEEWNSLCVDVNQGTVGELLQIPHMLEYEALAIVHHIAKHGPLRSLHELYGVSALDARRIRCFLPFLRIGASAAFHWKAFRGQAIQRVAYSAPVATTRGANRGAPSRLGSALGMQTRITGELPVWLRFGLKGSKSPHEPLFSRYAPAGYPFYSAFAEVKLPRNPACRVMLGDYTVRPGYGLILGVPPLAAQGYNPIAWNRSVIPRGSFALSDSHLLRGIGFSFGRPAGWLIEGGVSAKPTNATLRQADGRTTLIALPARGPFTTEASMGRRRSMWEFVGYTSFAYALERLRIGFTAAYMHFQHAMETMGRPWHLRKIPPQLLRCGPHFHIYHPRVRVFGEAVSEFQSPHAKIDAYISYLLGITGRIASGWSAGLVLYHYGGAGHTRHQTVYAPTAQVYPGGHGLRIAGEYHAHQHHAVLTGQLYAGRAADGRYATVPQRLQVRMDYTYQISPRWGVSGVLKHAQGGQPIGNRRREVYQEGHLRIDYGGEQGWGATIRIGLMRNALRASSGGWGWGLLQDMGYSTPSFSLKARIAYFHLENAGLALYFYEHGPLYTFHIHRHAHNGARGYIYAKWLPLPRLALWAKLSHTMLTSTAEADRPQSLELIFQVGYTI